METLIQQTIESTNVRPSKHGLIVKNFITWCESQEKYRFGWLAGIVAGHGCVLTPLTLFAIFLAGNNIIFWFLAAAAMAMSLVTNLAALPTKITIPVFFLSVIIDLVIVVNCIVIVINNSATYI